MAKLCFAAAVVLASFPASATTLYTFGADQFGAPTSLNQMDPSSASSVANVVTPLGDGNTGFNGGLVFDNGLLYAVGNDSSGNASIYSFTLGGGNLTTVSSDFNDTGGANGFGFYNGLAAIGGTLYAIGTDNSGEDLFQIGNGSATLVQSLATFGGTYAGLAYASDQGVFYGVIANSDVGDLLVRIPIAGSAVVAANLTTLDGAEANTHLGGLAYAGNGIFYDIYTNVNDGNGELEQLSLNGSPAATTLYDTGIPLAQNAGIAITPEPSSGGLALIGCGVMLCGLFLKRRTI
ncbi:MAG TPA: hypothetical protein VKX39_01350 [Bryobacteraceae bacterium]|nr:hypothetical protein [Bryobacteraceae bacterium]